MADFVTNLVQEATVAQTRRRAALDALNADIARREKMSTEKLGAELIGCLGVSSDSSSLATVTLNSSHRVQTE